MAEAERAGIAGGCDPWTGSLLRLAAASKPGGHLLELGTGYGLGTAWLLAGMDDEARLTSVDVDPSVVEIAAGALGDEPRVDLVVEDAATFLRDTKLRFDLIFADAPPGKLQMLERALELLAEGGLYIVDDMLLTEDAGVANRAAKISALRSALLARSDLVLVELPIESGAIVAAKRGRQERQSTE